MESGAHLEKTPRSTTFTPTAGIIAESPQIAVPFGRYLLLKRIAVGGMAELFLAQDTAEGGRLVVIKRILPYLSTEVEFVRMFLDEARIAAQLDHPNIVHTFELGKLEDTIFIAMEYVEGIDLRKILLEAQRQKSVVPWRLAAFLTAEVAAALGAAHHSRGVDGRAMEIIHRDISPQNVMVGFDGHVKLVDFGIAKATTLVQNSKPGVIKGKFLYLSPEQLTQERLDSRSDLFPLGSMLYEAITGESPFYKASTEAIIYAIRNEEPPPPHLVRPGLPAELSRIVMRCLKKDRAKRYQDALEIERDLRALLAREAPTASHDVAGYVSALFGEEEERTVLHMPAPAEAPSGRVHETLPLAGAAARRTPSSPQSTRAPERHRSRDDLPKRAMGEGQGASGRPVEARLGPALEAERRAPALGDSSEPTASTAAERPEARAAAVRARRAETPASSLEVGGPGSVGATARTQSGESLRSLRRPSSERVATSSSKRTSSGGLPRARSSDRVPWEAQPEGSPGLKLPLSTQAVEEDPTRPGRPERGPSSERDPTVTKPIDSSLLEDLTPPPRRFSTAAPTSAGSQATEDEPSRTDQSASASGPRALHGALEYGDDDESTMNFPPDDEGEEADEAEEERTATRASFPRRVALWGAASLAAAALVAAVWLLSSLLSVSAGQLGAPKFLQDIAAPDERGDGEEPHTGALEVAADGGVPSTGPSAGGAPMALERATDEPSNTAREGIPDERKIIAVVAPPPRQVPVRLLAPRGTLIHGPRKERLALATPLEFPEGRLVLKVRCPGRRVKTRSQSVELKAEPGVVRSLAFCGAKLPK